MVKYLAAFFFYRHESFQEGCRRLKRLLATLLYLTHHGAGFSRFDLLGWPSAFVVFAPDAAGSFALYVVSETLEFSVCMIDGSGAAGVDSGGWWIMD